MRLGIIGAGRVGASFVLAFPSDVEGILCSTEEHTRQMARRLHAAAYTDGAELARHCDVLLLTVRDDALAPVSRELAASLTGDALPPQTCIFHCSGAMDLSPLEPLSRLGYPVGSLHPLQSFAEPSADRLKGIYMAVDGDERAKAVAADLVRTLGSTPFFVPPEDRMLYQLISRWTGSAGAASQALRPLVEGTMDNVRQRPLWQTALTGPVSRGDAGTVAKHLAVMPEKWLQPYCAFGCAAADLALENETITEKQHDTLTRILAMAEGVHHEQESNQSDH